jgi:alkylated DNA repair dioxygenase AlkB
MTERAILDDVASLFDVTPKLPPCVDYYPDWMAAPEADVLMATLLHDLAWEQKPGRPIYGKVHLTPRMTCWMGDRTYIYSGVVEEPHPWPDSLAELRSCLDAFGKFDSCLANLYRNGEDTVDWHADDEPELGQRPTIASVSLGAPRTFRLRHQQTRETYDIELGHGDLLVMRDESQAEYKHSIPPRKRVTQPRINLTFRWFSDR